MLVEAKKIAWKAFGQPTVARVWNGSPSNNRLGHKILGKISSKHVRILSGLGPSGFLSSGGSLDLVVQFGA